MNTVSWKKWISESIGKIRTFHFCEEIKASCFIKITLFRFLKMLSNQFHCLKVGSWEAMILNLKKTHVW